MSSRYIALKQYRTASPSPCCASKHVCHLPGGRSRTAVIRSTHNTSASTAAVRSTLLLRPTPYCPRWKQIIYYAIKYLYLRSSFFFWLVFFLFSHTLEVEKTPKRHPRITINGGQVLWTRLVNTNIFTYYTICLLLLYIISVLNDRTLDTKY